ncbi:16598_t:CDS:2, partial [Cetraspora pellucida]
VRCENKLVTLELPETVVDTDLFALRLLACFQNEDLLNLPIQEAALPKMEREIKVKLGCISNGSGSSVSKLPSRYAMLHSSLLMLS